MLHKKEKQKSKAMNMKVWNWKQLLKIGKMKFNQIVKEKIQPLHPVTFIRHMLDWKIKQDQKKENHITAILSLHPQKLNLQLSLTKSYVPGYQL